MGYRYGNFYFRQSPDGQGWDIFKDGSDLEIDWYGTTTGAMNECRRRHIEALEDENAALKSENVKLANQVDDMQHDFGVIAFCGLDMSKNDRESFRSTDSIEALQTLEYERDKRIMLECKLGEVHESNLKWQALHSQFSDLLLPCRKPEQKTVQETLKAVIDERVLLDDARGEISSLLEYVKSGRFHDEDGTDISPSAEGLELFNRLTELITDSMAGEFLSGEVTRLEEALKRAEDIIVRMAAAKEIKS